MKGQLRCTDGVHQSVQSPKILSVTIILPVGPPCETSTTAHGVQISAFHRTVRYSSFPAYPIPCNVLPLHSLNSFCNLIQLDSIRVQHSTSLTLTIPINTIYRPDLNAGILMILSA
eukprot:scpid110688/ scgid14986/ 